MHIEQSVAVSADGIEGDIAEIEKSCYSHYDVQTKTENDIHQCCRHDIGLISVKQCREQYRKGQNGSR